MKERLTKYSEINKDYITPYCDTVNCNKMCEQCDYEQVIINRLAEYEDKIERGELVERSELDKALALKQEQGQDLTVKTIFKFMDEKKALQAEIDDYKQKIKDGTLVEPPCKIGDKVYHIYRKPFSDYSIDEEIVRGYEYDVKDDWRLILTTFEPSIRCMGNNLFLTREEAEQKAKELNEELRKESEQ